MHTATVLGVLLLCSTYAHAQMPEERQRAAEHYMAGERHYEARRFADAVHEYEQAYALAPEAALQFNIALALEGSGEFARAIEKYERYLELDPHGSASEEARERATALKAKLAALEVKKPPDPKPPAVAVPRPAVVEAEPIKGADRSYKWLSLTGAGAASAGVGTFFALRSRKLEKRIEGTTEWTDSRLDSFSRGRRYSRISRSLLGLSLPLVVGGIVLHRRSWTAHVGVDSVTISRSF